MTSLSPIAVQNADVLRRIAPGNPFASKAELAKELNRDRSNFARTIERLQTDGLIVELGPESDKPLRLTDAGALMIRRLDAAENADQLQPGAIMVPHSLLRPNPLNPRKSFSEEEIQSLAETILSEGVLQNLTVSPADLLGVRLIYIGERRWRAARSLIEAGTWDADHPIPCVERQPNDDEEADALFLGLIENGRREPLTWLEEARAYHTLIERTGRSARDVALKTGKEPRVVQEMVKVVREATPEQIADLETGKITAEGLRHAVRTPTAPAAPSSTDRMNARLHERDRAQADATDQKYRQIVATFKDDGEAYLCSTAWKAVQDYDAAIRAGDQAEADEQIARYDAVIQKLNGGERFGSATIADRVAEYCKAGDGQLPLWGQRGAFVIQCEGFRALVVTKGGLRKRHCDVEFHAIDVEQPFISETGYRSHFASQAYGSSLQEALPHWAYYANWDSLKNRPNKSLLPIDPNSRKRLKASVPAWVFEAEALRVSAYTPEAPKSGAQSDIEDIAPRPKPEPLKLTPHEMLALVELAHKIGEEGTAIGGDLAVPVGKIWIDASVSVLVQHRLIETKNYGARGWHANTTQAGHEYLLANGFALDGFGDPITAERLESARAAARCEVQDDAYCTEWLNLAEPEAEHTAEDEDDPGSAPEPNYDADADLAAEAQAIRIDAANAALQFNGTAFAALLERCGIKLPIEIMADHGVVVAVLDADQEVIAEIDVDCLWSDNRNQAVAQLIAIALNKCAGLHELSSQVAEG